MLDVGTRAPEWSAPDQTGRVIDSNDLLGRWVVMWWYPRASTPG